MKPPSPAWLVRGLVLFLSAAGAAGQGTFQNLDFESARDIPVFDPRGHPWTMPAGDALPGWTCYLGTNQYGSAWYNDVALDSAAVGIQSSTSPYPPAGLIEGQYCASLQYGYVFTGPYTYYFGPAAIAQSGQIPGDAQSIWFEGTVGLSISFAGSAIPMVVWSTETGYDLYGGDISQFAGQTGELRITSYNHFGYIDSVGFSDEQVPEPGVFALSTLGVLLVGWRFLWRRRCRPS